MRVVPGMDRSLAITTGRAPAEAMIVEFVAAGRPSDAPMHDSGNPLPI
jgi:hypothetical protein